MRATCAGRSTYGRSSSLTLGVILAQAGREGVICRLDYERSSACAGNSPACATGACREIMSNSVATVFQVKVPG